MEIFFYLSNLLGRPVLDQNEQRVGSLYDVSMSMNDEVYPRAVGYTLKRGWPKAEFAYIRADDVESIGDVFKLKITQDQLRFGKGRQKLDFTLRNDILDQQVVDTDNQKVVRVNDVHMLKVEHQLYLAHVDVGLRGLVRRLEWTTFVDALVKLLYPKSPYLTSQEFIPWKNTQVLSLGRVKNVLRMDIARKRLAQIPPIELAEIMEDLDIFEKYSLFKSLDTNMQRKVFADLSIEEKEEVIDQLSDKEASDLLVNIPADEATDMLMALPKSKRFQLMRLMESDSAKMFRKLLGFAKDSAGGLMTTEYLYLDEKATVEDAFNKIKENTQYPGNIFNIYIVDEQHRLLGATSLRRFINSDPKTPILETAYPKNVFVRTDDEVEEIALLLEKYKFFSIPVLDEEDVLQGVITSDDVMEELISLAWGKYKEKL